MTLPTEEVTKILRVEKKNIKATQQIMKFKFHYT